MEQPGGVIVIGASTGGPEVLEKILPLLTEELCVGVLVAQHMPEKFTQSMTQRFSDICKMPIKETEDGELYEAKHIYVCKGSANTWLSKSTDGAIRINVSSDSIVKLTPSIDILFSSAAEIFEQSTLGIILTGMGDDGLFGCHQIKKYNGTVIAQDEGTSAVYGMAKEVARAKLADFILPSDRIVHKINHICYERRHKSI